MGKRGAERFDSEPSKVTAVWPQELASPVRFGIVTPEQLSYCLWHDRTAVRGPLPHHPGKEICKLFTLLGDRKGDVHYADVHTTGTGTEQVSIISAAANRYSEEHLAFRDVPDGTALYPSIVVDRLDVPDKDDPRYLAVWQVVGNIAPQARRIQRPPPAPRGRDAREMPLASQPQKQLQARRKVPTSGGDRSEFALTSLAEVVTAGANAAIPFSTILGNQVNTGVSSLLDKPLLIHGPPYVGKTCWAIRHAWLWLQAGSDDDRCAFFVTPKYHDAAILERLASQVKPAAPLLFVIDDIHLAHPHPELWARCLNEVVRHRGKGDVRVVWTARSDELAGALDIGSLPKLFSWAFPTELVIARFREQLASFNEWQRIVAALETGLDAHLASVLQPLRAPTESPENFSRWIKEHMDRTCLTHLRDVATIDGICNAAAKRAFLLMLPAATLDYGLPRSFYLSNGVNAYTLTALEDRGVIYVNSSTLTVHLTEHPFRAKRLLRVAERFGEYNDLLGLRSGSATSTPSDAVLSEYVKSIPPVSAGPLIRELYEYADWAGVRDTAAGAFRALMADECNSVVSSNVHILAEVRYKTARKSFPDDEQAFSAELDGQLDYWSSQLKKKNCGMHRKSTIHYEIGYVHYLRESYADAEQCFTSSVNEAVALIKEGLLASRGSISRTRGVKEFTEVWGAKVLCYLARLRAELTRWLDGSASAAAVVSKADVMARDLGKLCGLMRSTRLCLKTVA